MKNQTFQTLWRPLYLTSHMAKFGQSSAKGHARPWNCVAGWSGAGRCGLHWSLAVTWLGATSLHPLWHRSSIGMIGIGVEAGRAGLLGLTWLASQLRTKSSNIFPNFPLYFVIYVHAPYFESFPSLPKSSSYVYCKQTPFFLKVMKSDSLYFQFLKDCAWFI